MILVEVMKQGFTIKLLIEDNEKKSFRIRLKNSFESWAPHNKRLRVQGREEHKFYKISKDFGIDFESLKF